MPTTGPAVKNHISPKNGKRIDCKKANNVPFVVPGLSTSSSTSSSRASSTSSSQDSVFDVNRYTENIVPKRSGSTSEELRRNPLHRSTENENTNKNEDDEEFRSELLQDVLVWLQDFKENLVDKHVHLHQYSPSSFHELPMEPRAKVVPGPGKHRIYTHGFLQRTYWYSRAQCGKNGDLITADHKVLSDGCESRHNHRYVVVAQDLATQWLQSYPCKTTTSQETQKSLMKFLEPTSKPKVIYTDNSLELGKSCEELSGNPCTSTPHT